MKCIGKETHTAVTVTFGLSAILPLSGYGRVASYTGVSAIDSHKPTCEDEFCLTVDQGAISGCAVTRAEFQTFIFGTARKAMHGRDPFNYLPVLNNFASRA
jgi:hypothetical protein